MVHRYPWSNAIRCLIGLTNQSGIVDALKTTAVGVLIEEVGAAAAAGGAGTILDAAGGAGGTGSVMGAVFGTT